MHAYCTSITIIDNVYLCVSPMMCIDSNECVDGNNDCSENAECFDTPELFGCVCNSGFVGDGRTCTGTYYYVL